jgi:hypothetical protein
MGEETRQEVTATEARGNRTKQRPEVTELNKDSSCREGKGLTWTQREPLLFQERRLWWLVALSSLARRARSEFHCLRVTVEMEHQASGWCLLCLQVLPPGYLYWLPSGSENPKPRPSEFHLQKLHPSKCLLTSSTE